MMMTPSATAPARRNMRGWLAARKIGSAGPGLPAIFIVMSPVVEPASRERSRRTAASSSSTRWGRSPIEYTALSPAPIPARIRPGARARSVTSALATTVSCRVTRLVTPGPSRMALVSCAATARREKASRMASCESTIQQAATPSSSASRMRPMTRSIGSRWLHPREIPSCVTDRLRAGGGRRSCWGRRAAGTPRVGGRA